MNQIDSEMQVMRADFIARHDPVVIKAATAWHLVSAVLSKVRERKGDASDPAMDAVQVELGNWRTTYLAAQGISESEFDAALIDMRRMTLTHHELQKIDEVNAL